MAVPTPGGNNFGGRFSALLDVLVAVFDVINPLPAQLEALRKAGVGVHQLIEFGAPRIELLDKAGLALNIYSGRFI